MTRSLIILICLLLIFQPAYAQDDATTKTTTALNVRTGPGPAYVVIASLPAGTPVTMEGRDPSVEWVMVTGGGVRGWVSTCCIVTDADLSALPLNPERGAKYEDEGETSPGQASPESQPTAAPSTPATSGTASVTTALRMREGPNEEDEMITVLKRGSTVTVINTSPDGYWARVRTASGTEGWVSTCCITVETTEPAGGAPSTSNPPTGWGAMTKAALNVRQGPGLSYTDFTEIPPQTPVVIEARDATNGWVLVHTPANERGWVASAYLQFDAGTEMDYLPITDEIVAGQTASPPPATEKDWQTASDIQVIRVGSRAREIFLRGQTQGNDPNAFSTIGDCNSDIGVYLGFFAWGPYNLGPYAYLQPVIDHFSGSFGRQSVTTWTGNHAWMLFDSTWANPDLCRPGESPLECEYRRHRPSIFLIELGTNEAGAHTFADDLRAIVDYAIDKGVIPVLATKAHPPNSPVEDNNATIRALAAEYNVPLWDFGAVAETLPANGLRADEVHLTWHPLDYTETAAQYAGHPVHNLTALMALDAVWREAMQ